MTPEPDPLPPPAASRELPPATYQRMGSVLRIGLAVSLTLLAVAGTVAVARQPFSSAGAWVANNPLNRYLDLRVLAAGLASGSPTAYLTLGVFALIATPVVRVVAGTVAFAHHRERALAAITLAVLVLLLIGLLVIGPLVR